VASTPVRSRSCVCRANLAHASQAHTRARPLLGARSCLWPPRSILIVVSSVAQGRHR
jgi:hypothetical protein